MEHTRHDAKLSLIIGLVLGFCCATLIPEGRVLSSFYYGTAGEMRALIYTSAVEASAFEIDRHSRY
jgi:hypothetical protein